MVESNGEKRRSHGDHQEDGGAAEPALKKGPWTTAEDGILIEYVQKHGEGNWNAVQKHTGLARCGKSCRLRWANHLRPNLKKGSFSQEEERLIIELHAKLGNKWARMAAQVPPLPYNTIFITNYSKKLMFFHIVLQKNLKMFTLILCSYCLALFFCF